MNWIFKVGDHFKFASNSQKTVVTFKQKRNFSGKENENVLILEKTNQDWAFTAQYQISNINVKNFNEGYKQIIITLDLVQHFPENKHLDVYIYSLLRISNFTYPIKHFNRKYSRLYDVEFVAIVKDKIYLKRTILGTVLNSMHSDHQRAYLAYTTIEAPEIIFRGVDIDRALKLLLQYLDFAVIKPACYLMKSEELLKSIISEKEIAEIGFVENIDNSDPKNTQMLKLQVDIIKEYLHNMIGFNFKLYDSQVHKLDDNREFKSLFKNSPLPITLK